MKSPHGMDTSQNVAKSVGAVVALAVLLGLAILIISSKQASLVLGYTLIVGFLAAFVWALFKVRRENKTPR